MNKTRFRWLILLAAVILAMGIGLVWWALHQNADSQQAFDGQRAYQDVITQVNFGPRIPESQAHQDTIQYIQNILIQAGWNVSAQNVTYQDHPVYNIVAQRGNAGPWVVLGAHYDSRMAADQDPQAGNQTSAVPGANDGASGVAVLLELARTLPVDLNKQIWLVFFDSEDQGDLQGWNWIIGSQVFADNLQGQPDAVVVLDMIGDADLNIYKERNSDKNLTEQIWSTAADLGYARQFIPEYKYSMLDDHTPFLKKGIPAVDIIDFDYPYWHTVDDTADKVSAKSLQEVGDTMAAWLNATNTP